MTVTEVPSDREGYCGYHTVIEDTGIGMTANALEEDRKAAFAAGMNGHVAKPVDVKELADILAKFLQ